MQDYQNLETLLKLLKSGQMDGGWLLIGPKGVGKARTAYKLASEIYKKPVESLLSGSHGAFKVLECELTEEEKKKRQALIDDGKELDPEEESKRARKTSISIDDVRKIIDFTGFKALAAEPKIVLVDSMNDMQEEAANAFLKTLEEPPSNTAFLLICHNEHRVLDTIKSRCRKLYFKRLPLSEMEKIIGDKEVSRLADGCPGRASKIKEQKVEIDKLKEAIALKDTKKTGAAIDRLLKMEEGDFTLKTVVLEEILKRADNANLKEKNKYADLFSETEKRFAAMDGLYLEKKNTFINQIIKIWS